MKSATVKQQPKPLSLTEQIQLQEGRINELRTNLQLLSQKPLEGVSVSYQGDGLEFFQQLSQKLADDAEKTEALAVLDAAKASLVEMELELGRLQQQRQLELDSEAAEQAQLAYEADMAKVPELAAKLAEIEKQKGEVLQELYEISLRVNPYKGKQWRENEEIPGTYISGVKLGSTVTYTLEPYDQNRFPTADWSLVQRPFVYAQPSDLF
jgi:hypothetical protein